MTAPEKVPCDQCATSTPKADLERCDECAAYVCPDCIEDGVCTGCRRTRTAR